MSRKAQMGYDVGVMRWRMETTFNKDRHRAMRKQLGSQKMGDTMDKIWRRRVRKGLAKFASGVTLTKSQKKIINRLFTVVWEKMKRANIQWRIVTNDKTRALYETKKARVLDRLVQASMSKDQQAIRIWMQYTWAMRMKEHGERATAFYIIKHFIRKFRYSYDMDNKRWAANKMSYDPVRILMHTIEKMIRTGNNFTGKALLLWKLSTLHDKEMRTAATRKLASNLMAAVLDRNYKRRLRIPFNLLA